MMELKIFEYVEEKRKLYHHHNMSITLNWMIRQLIILEKAGKEQQQQQLSETQKTDHVEFIGDLILKDIVEKMEKDTKK